MLSAKPSERNKVIAALQVTEGLDEVVFSMDGSTAEWKANGRLRLRIGKHAYNIAPEAYIKACRDVGIAESYAAKTPQELIVPHLNYWFSEKSADMKALVRGDDIITFTKPTVVPYSQVKILEAMEEVVGRVELYDKVYSSLEFSQWALIGAKCADMANRMSWPVGQDFLYPPGTPTSTGEKVGDLVAYGVHFQNSVVGAQPLMIAGYLYQIVCVNGSISPSLAFKWSRRSDDEFLTDWVQSGTAQAWDAAQTEFEKLYALKSIPVPADVAPEILRHIFSEFGVMAEVRSEVLEALVKRGEVETMYDLYNAITYAASNSKRLEENPLLMRRMMGVGGMVLEHPQACSECHRLLPI